MQYACVENRLRGGGGEKHADWRTGKLMNSQMGGQSPLTHSGGRGGGVSDLILDVF